MKKAIENQFKVKLNPKDFDISNNYGSNLKLIVDGGSENNNFIIHDFIKSCHINIKKKIAMKDVTFSNSVIEETYRIMKTHTLEKSRFFLQPLNRNWSFLLRIITAAVRNTFIKFILRIKPNEVVRRSQIFNNPQLKDQIPLLSKVNKKRIYANRKFCCKNI